MNLSIADLLLLTSVGLWVVWALIAVFRRKAGGSCCASCSGNCSGCERNRKKGKSDYSNSQSFE